ncbi:hypothetical protein [Sphingosinicella sp. BN140058]|uniref:hypothetical protein n=1 Tax=Sphingosinicella sp. BN140058 TaxID=1892855 RepID=UPI001FB0B50E|nr:hypothetical protein [Sphingosinicella sp. BN140058]
MLTVRGDHILDAVAVDVTRSGYPVAIDEVKALRCGKCFDTKITERQLLSKDDIIVEREVVDSVTIYVPD